LTSNIRMQEIRTSGLHAAGRWRAWAASATLVVAAGLAGCAATAGFNVDARQERLIKPGMTTTEVLNILGQPTRNMTYRNRPGPTFTYRVIPSITPMLFDVDFDASGKVESTSERMDLDRDGRRGLGGL
jgi:hypothetical protein